MIKQFHPVGYIYTNNKTYYAISLEKLSDESGNPLGGFGWVAVYSMPTNIQDAEDASIPMIYPAPEFVVGGAFIVGIKMPYYINCYIEGDDNVEENIDTILNEVFA